MRVVITTESRVVRAPDGTFWCDSASASREWPRYLRTFDRVGVAVRTRDGEPGPALVPIADTADVIPIPDFAGSISAWTARRQVRGILERFVGDDAVIVRSPGFISTLVADHAHRIGRRYGAEVHGDPAVSLRRAAVRHPAQPLARSYVTRGQRRSIRNAAAVLYVARDFLEPRYPASPDAFIVEAASSSLDDEWFAEARDGALRGRRLRVISVASLSPQYKRVDVVIDAVADCAARGLDLELVVLGEGALRPALERRARERGVGDRVTFAGDVSPVRVRDELDQADIFVLASEIEAMPRALLEAMARGVPSIATPVGGVPRLLPLDALVPVGDVAALADAIDRLAGDDTRRAKRSRENRRTADEYSERHLAPQRERFYEAVRDAAAVGAR